jgi:hypothetical protein
MDCPPLLGSERVHEPGRCFTYAIDSAGDLGVEMVARRAGSPRL